MFRTILTVASLVGAAAFAPVSQVARSSALKMSYTDPIASALERAGGSGTWDPLGLLNDADEERFERLRYVETKHGRISMLAIVGHIVTAAGVIAAAAGVTISIILVGESIFAIEAATAAGGEAANNTVAISMQGRV